MEARAILAPARRTFPRRSRSRATEFFSGISSLFARKSRISSEWSGSQSYPSSSVMPRRPQRPSSSHWSWLISISKSRFRCSMTVPLGVRGLPHCPRARDAPRGAAPGRRQAEAEAKGRRKTKAVARARAKAGASRERRRRFAIVYFSAVRPFSRGNYFFGQPFSWVADISYESRPPSRGRGGPTADG